MGAFGLGQIFCTFCRILSHPATSCRLLAAPFGVQFLASDFCVIFCFFWGAIRGVKIESQNQIFGMLYFCKFSDPVFIDFGLCFGVTFRVFRMLLAPPGSSWLLLAPPGSSWLLLDRPGSSCLLLAPLRALTSPKGSERDLQDAKRASKSLKPQGPSRF